jgi:hypothetical protein
MEIGEELPVESVKNQLLEIIGTSVKISHHCFPFSPSHLTANIYHHVI